MRFIRLINTDKIALVDKDMFAIINKYKWSVQNGRNYAVFMPFEAMGSIGAQTRMYK
jgi:hypothetical protein